MSFPPHLLDELARVFARVALDRLLKESAAREPRQDDENGDVQRQVSPPKGNGVADDVDSN
jgi:hypothetical protein